MNPFFCMFMVNLKTARPVWDEAGKFDGFIVGYYRNIGVRAEDVKEVKRLIELRVDDGTIDWDEFEVFDFDHVDEEIRRKYRANRTDKIWFLSGRIFFPPDEAN